MYADCKNGQRFYINENEIVNNSTVISEKEKLKSLISEHKYLCESKIKEQLNYPSTYKYLITESAWETQDRANVFVIGFKAKNAFNLKAKYRAICSVNTKNEFVDFGIQEN